MMSSMMHELAMMMMLQLLNEQHNAQVGNDAATTA
jgi:hypothetical protein